MIQEMKLQGTAQKAMIGFRMNPELKEGLEHEAKERGMTVSAYIETLIINRSHNSADIEKLRDRIFELESANAEIQQQNQKILESGSGTGVDTHQMAKELQEKAMEVRLLKQDKAELGLQLSKALKERELIMKLQGKPIPAWISPEGYSLLVQILNRLQLKYPNRTHEEVILSCLGVIDYNENSPLFIIGVLEKFWKNQPNFLKSIKQKGGIR